MGVSAGTPLKDETVTEHGARRFRLLWPIPLFVALVIGLVGGWLVFGGDGVESTVDADVEQEITALIDDFYLAWHNADGELALSLFTGDGRYVGIWSDMDGWSGEELVAGVERWGGTFTDPVRSGKPLIIDRSDAYHVVQIWQQTFEEHNARFDLFNIVEVDGSLKIRYTEGWQPMGWSQAAEGLPFRPVPEDPYQPGSEDG